MANLVLLSLLKGRTCGAEGRDVGLKGQRRTLQMKLPNMPYDYHSYAFQNIFVL